MIATDYIPAGLEGAACVHILYKIIHLGKLCFALHVHKAEQRSQMSMRKNVASWLYKPTVFLIARVFPEGTLYPSDLQPLTVFPLTNAIMPFAWKLLK